MKPGEKAPSAERLGIHLRDLVLDVYIRRNPLHERGKWEIPDFSRGTWALVVEELIRAGWRPPLGEGVDR